MADNALSAHRDANAHLVPRQIAGRVWACNDPNNVMLTRMLSGGMNKFKFNRIGACKIEWMEDGGLPEATEIICDVPCPESCGTDCNHHNVYDTEVIAVENAALFIKYSVWSIDPPPDPLNCPPDETTTMAADSGNDREFIYVYERDCLNNTVTVMRGWNGTCVNEIKAGTCIRLEFTVAPECPVYDGPPPVARTTNCNYIQTFVSGYQTTKKFSIVEHYGSSSELEIHRARIMGGNAHGQTMDGQLVQQFENALLRGLPNPGASDGSHAAMGGIDSFNIPQYTAGGGLDYRRLCEIFQKIYRAGGMVNNSNYVLMVSPEAKMMIDDMAQPTMHNNQSGMNQKWGVSISSFQSTFGEIGITMHRRMRPNEMYLMDTSKIGWIPIMNWEEGALAKESILCDRFQIAGMFTMALACRCHHAKIIICPWCSDWECVGGCRNAPPKQDNCEPGVVVGPPGGKTVPGAGTPTTDDEHMGIVVPEKANAAQMTPEQRLALAQRANKQRQGG